MWTWLLTHLTSYCSFCVLTHFHQEVLDRQTKRVNYNLGLFFHNHHVIRKRKIISGLHIYFVLTILRTMSLSVYTFCFYTFCWKTVIRLFRRPNFTKLILLFCYLKVQLYLDILLEPKAVGQKMSCEILPLFQISCLGFV